MRKALQIIFLLFQLCLLGLYLAHETHHSHQSYLYQGSRDYKIDSEDIILFLAIGFHLDLISFLIFGFVSLKDIMLSRTNFVSMAATILVAVVNFCFLRLYDSITGLYKTSGAENDVFLIAKHMLLIVLSFILLAASLWNIVRKNKEIDLEATLNSDDTSTDQ